MLKAILLVGIGGAAGSVLRYLTSVISAKYVQTEFPIATFAVNIIGCLLIGVLIGMIGKQQFSNPEFKLLLVTGFCGGFTTFSAFAYDNVTLFQQGNTLIAFLYIASSVILSLAAVFVGMYLVKG